MQRSLTQPGSKPEDAGAGLSRAWRLLHRTLGPDDAIARGGLTLEGPRRALERFVEAFAWSG